MISVSLVYNRKKVAGNTAGIEVRITHLRHSHYISTGVRVRKSEWRNGLIVNRPDAVELNERVECLVNNINMIVNERLRDGVPIDVVDVKRAAWNMSDGKSANDEVLEWMTEQIPNLNLCEKTRERYVGVLRRLVEFGRFSRWSDVTVENLYAFDTWVRRKNREGGELSDAAVYNYHKCLKALLNRAVRFGVLSQNPYERVKGKFKRGDCLSVEYLTEDEIAAFESLNIAHGSLLARAHDLFIFQLWTGLSYSDTQHFNIKNYRLVDGSWSYTGLRIKTGVPYVSVLLPPVVAVLERNSWIVPKIDNADYNRCLKLLGEMAGINTPLHSHLARHTFATFMLRHGVKIENVSKMLGHTNITQTQRYAKVLAMSVHEEFERISDLLITKTKKQ